MPSTTNIPPSIAIILNRIDYWREQQEKSTCSIYIQDCENTISELELVKKMTKNLT